MDASQATYIQQAQTAIVESVDAAAEAERRQREIGYSIEYYPAQTTSQPK